MPYFNADGRSPERAAKPVRTAIVVLVLACLGLTACGESSKSTSTSASTSATSAVATTGAGGGTATGAGSGTATAAGGGTATGAGGGTGHSGSRAGRLEVIRECLQKNGITLPQRPAGTTGGVGGPQLPKGVTRAQYEAIVEKCGGHVFGGAGRLKTPAYKVALAKFAACMRENGVNVPPPNTSGSGPVFNTKGLNATGAQFKAAETKCTGDLTGGFRGGRASGPSGGTG